MNPFRSTIRAIIIPASSKTNHHAGTFFPTLTIATVLAVACSWSSGCSKRRNPAATTSTDTIRPENLPRRPALAHRALTMKFVRLVRLYPAFRWQARSTLDAILPPGTRETLEEEYLLEKDENGTIHGRHFNSREFGYEFFWKKNRYYYRNRYMPLRHRPDEGQEHLHNAQQEWSVIAAYWRLVDRFCRLKYKGKAVADNRPAYRFAVKLRTVPRRLSPGGSRPSDNALQKAWRKSLTVTAAEGQVLFDQATGAPITFDLKVNFTFVRKGKRATALLTYKHTVNAKRKGWTVTIPPSIPAPAKERPELDRRALLGRVRPPGWFRGGGPIRAWKRSRRLRRPVAPRRPRTRRPAPAPRPRR